MKSKYSLILGRPLGIKLSVHWTFLLLIAYIVFISIQRGLNVQQILMHIIFVFAIFVCVVLHELGHSLVAIKLGGKVHSITLLPIGGMANISEMPEKPRDEFLMSLGGPVVNVIIAFIVWIYLKFAHPVAVDEMTFEYITLDNFPLMLIAVNIFILAFNLIPAFPMDGGRLFRSALAMRYSRLKATRIAKNIGQGFAVLFIIAGLYFNPFLIVIGFFILLGAGSEYEMTKQQYVLNKFEVKDILVKKYAKLDENDTIEKAAKEIVKIPNKGFVITSDDEYIGILSKNNIIDALSNFDKSTKVKEVMNKNIQTLSPETELFEVYKKMTQNNQDILPVMKNDKFIGILDIENVNELVLIQNAKSKV